MVKYAVIPARGGSKGLPMKNIRLLHGKPLLAYMIKAAQEALQIDKVFVSTDSHDISKIAMEYGAELIIRPAELSDDTASSESVLFHAVEFFVQNKIEVPDVLLLLQCTSPFTTSVDIDGTIQALLENNAESALAVVPFQHFLWKEGYDSYLKGINHDGKIRQRRQDLEPQYLEAGSVYAMRTDCFLKEKTRFCGNTTQFVCSDSHRCLEIDDAADFFMAEAMFYWQMKAPEIKEQYRNRFTLYSAFPKELGAIICDFDGVFTDNTVFTLQNGDECVRCDRSDGAGLAFLKKIGVPIIVLSSEINIVVEARCRKLGIECYHGIEQKALFLDNFLKNKGLTWEEIIYVGNDLNDKECLELAGTGIVPSDAHTSVLFAADLVLPSKGGKGFLRELCDLVCEAMQSRIIYLKNHINKNSFYYVGQKDERKWGTWEVLSVSSDYCIKKLCIFPNKQISLQYHEHRNELWKIIKGSGLVINNDIVRKVGVEDIVNISKKEVHQIKNITDEELVLIEIQTGEELNEEDIVRFL